MANHHLIFEGAELAGKSWLMAQVYNYIEPKYNQSGVILDGCHWFNCDVGIFGTAHGRAIITDYVKIFSELKNNNLIAEKLHLSDIVYNRLHRHTEINYQAVEQQLKDLGFKIVLITFPEDEELLRHRLQDRLNLYPHYQRIAREPKWYIEQQREYLGEIKKTTLPSLVIEVENFPNKNAVNKIMEWIGE